MIDPNESSEEQSTHGLLLRLREGDRSAADTLFRIHRRRLLRALRARLSPEARPLIEREELVQETFSRALSSLDRFEWRGQGAFLAWLLEIARRTLQDEIRREQCNPVNRALHVGLDADDSLDVPLPADNAGTPSSLLARAEELEFLDRALDHLEDADRDLVIRRKILEQDYESLAVDLRMTEGAVRMRLSRAMMEMSRWAQERT